QGPNRLARGQAEPERLLEHRLGAVELVKEGMGDPEEMDDLGIRTIGVRRARRLETLRRPPVVPFLEGQTSLLVLGPHEGRDPALLIGLRLDLRPPPPDPPRAAHALA